MAVDGQDGALIGSLVLQGLCRLGVQRRGKSRLRGVEAELDCGLVGGSPEVGEEVANLLLAGVDDLLHPAFLKTQEASHRPRPGEG